MPLFRDGALRVYDLPRSLVRSLGPEKLAALGFVRLPPTPKRLDQLAPSPLAPRPPRNRAERRAAR